MQRFLTPVFSRVVAAIVAGLTGLLALIGIDASPEMAEAISQIASGLVTLITLVIYAFVHPLLERFGLRRDEDA